MIVSQAAFQPVAITLTFESQKELDAFGSLMNSSPIADILYETGEIKARRIYDQCGNAGGNIHNTEQIYNALRERFKHLVAN